MGVIRHSLILYRDIEAVGQLLNTIGKVKDDVFFIRCESSATNKNASDSDILNALTDMKNALEGGKTIILFNPQIPTLNALHSVLNADYGEQQIK